MPVAFVPTLRVENAVIDLDELAPGTQRTAGFPIFLPTRASLHLEAKEKTGDPCCRCSIQPLSADEIEYFQRQKKEGPMPMLGGYHVKVTVSERAGDKQMDLGPFQREILVSSDEIAETGTLVVKGVVMGEVRILGEHKHRIDFSVFDSRNEAKVQLKLEADRPAIQLQAESHSPEYLQVDLKDTGVSPSGGKQWDLTVAVPPGKAYGRLPADSVVVLTTQESPPRRFRIPVVGHGTLK